MCVTGDDVAGAESPSPRGCAERPEQDGRGAAGHVPRPRAAVSISCGCGRRVPGVQQTHRGPQVPVGDLGREGQHG